MFPKNTTGKTLAFCALYLVAKCVLVIVAVLFDAVLPDHEPDPSVRRWPAEKRTIARFGRGQVVGPRGVTWVKPFARWDAAQFLEVAWDGYQEETQFAFFPLWPFLMRGASWLFVVVWGWTRGGSGSDAIDEETFASLGVAVNICLGAGTAFSLGGLLKWLRGPPDEQGHGRPGKDFEHLSALAPPRTRENSSWDDAGGEAADTHPDSAGVVVHQRRGRNRSSMISKRSDDRQQKDVDEPERSLLEAWTSSVYFWAAINPATVFFSTNYSEGSFAFLHFTACWLLERGFYLPVICVFFFLASCARANGVLALILVFLNPRTCPLAGFVQAARFGCLAGAILFPLIAWNLVAAIKFCSEWRGAGSFAEMLPRNALWLVETPFRDLLALQEQQSIPSWTSSSEMTSDPPWCAVHEGTGWSAWLCRQGVQPTCVPNLYSYVQQTHWNCGFLRYWQLKQVPNFALAAPAFFLVYQGCVLPALQVTVKQLRGNQAPRRAALLRLLAQNPLLKYRIYTAVISTFILFNAHVQIVTRVLWASSPVMYWMACENTYYGRYVRKWTWLYAPLGLLLHCNFLPWT